VTMSPAPTAAKPRKPKILTEEEKRFKLR